MPNFLSVYDAFLICVIQKFQNWNIIISIHNRFWSYSMLINYVFGVEESNHYDFFSRFCLFIVLGGGKSVCFHTLAADVVSGPKWWPNLHYIVIKIFKKSGPFQISLYTHNFFDFLLGFIFCKFMRDQFGTNIGEFGNWC